MSQEGRKRFLLGGLGALAPVFVLLLAVDLEQSLAGASPFKMLGYGVRVAVLFAIGGLIAWLHETENVPFKLFEIGVGAPALLAGLLTSGAVGPAGSSKPAGAVSWLPVSAAYAQGNTTPEKPDAKEFTAPRQSKGGTFLEGLLGTRQESLFYVITGSYKNYQEAKAKADAINDSSNNLKAQVYAPYGGNPYYAVVIGDPLPLAAAADLKNKAISAGLARDTYLWTPANPAAKAPVAAVEQGPWAVVFGADKSLAAAQHEVTVATRKTGLPGAQIYLRDNIYRSVAIFADRSNAEDALGRARTQRGDAYVVDFSKWCPASVPQDKYRECQR